MWGSFNTWISKKRFIECFQKEDIDYLVWMTPYKRYQYAPEKLQPPKAVVYDLKNANYKLIEYDERRMVSSEE